MHNESSIFDQDFLKDISSIRRRKLMPLALKIYVWMHMIFSALTTIGPILLFIVAAERYQLNHWGIGFAVLRFLSDLFIWLEKKWAILTALITVSIFMIGWGKNLVSVLSFPDLIPSDIILPLCIIGIEVPYLVLLLKIKRPWETAVVPDKK